MRNALSGQKAGLLRGAARRGPKAFFRQTWLAVADSILRQKHLVFRLASTKLLHQEFHPPEGWDFAEFHAWEALPQAWRLQLSDLEPGKTYWGSAAWFDRGWSLWAASSDGQLGAVSWWCNAGQSREFFCRVPEDHGLLWQSAVMPAFLGSGLHVALLISVMRHQARRGVNGFFINCREYNTPSCCNILRMGFELIGYVTISKISGRRTRYGLPLHTGNGP